MLMIDFKDKWMIDGLLLTLTTVNKIPKLNLCPSLSKVKLKQRVKKFIHKIFENIVATH